MTTMFIFKKPNEQIKRFRNVATGFKIAASKYPKFEITPTKRNYLFEEDSNEPCFYLKNPNNQNPGDKGYSGSVPQFYALSFKPPKDVTREEGMKKLTLDLGFQELLHVQEFMSDFPQVWGNEYGWDLFNFPYAYSAINPEGPLLFGEDVVYHWEGVVERFLHVLEMSAHSYVK